MPCSTVRHRASGTRMRRVPRSMPSTSVRRDNSGPTASGQAATSRARMRSGAPPNSRAAVSETPALVSATRLM
jgi:hypothetical protein